MLTKTISDLEQQVMNIIWTRKQCTVRDILNEIHLNRPMAYTTVLTLVQRLYEKGLVSKKEKGKAYLYTPRVSRERYTKNVADSFLKKFISSFGDIAVASFADSIETLPKEKREQLLELLEKHETHK